MLAIDQELPQILFFSLHPMECDEGTISLALDEQCYGCTEELHSAHAEMKSFEI
jgi:hypothetical protein